jgi:hypothetical protein
MRGGCFFSNAIIHSLARTLKHTKCQLTVTWVSTTKQQADKFTRIPLERGLLYEVRSSDQVPTPERQVG